MRSKRIYTNTKRTRWIIVRLYNTRKEMRAAYKEFQPSDKGHNEVFGVHCAYDKVNVDANGASKQCGEKGTVFLSLQDCGAGVVAHELGHAVFWGLGRLRKKQYPIVIKNMQQEEVYLHNLTYAIIQFYRWYWKVVEEKTPLRGV